jgi:hypothetical protein
MIALDLVQAEKGKIDKTMVDRATSLLQKGKTLPEAGKFRAIAQVGLRRLQYRQPIREVSRRLQEELEKASGRGASEG